MAIDNIEDAYRVYFPLIREKCSRMLRDPQDAQDIAQETFVRLWQNRDAVTETPAIAAWLYRTSTRLAADLLRQRKRRPTTILTDDLTGDPTHRSVGARFDAARDLERIATKTPKKELEAAILSRIDGMSHVEIAKVSGVSERTVRRLLRSFDKRTARFHTAANRAAANAQIGDNRSP